MNESINDGGWRSFILLLGGMLAMLGAFANLVVSEGGSGAFRWILVSFLLLMALLAGGLALDWNRLDRATRVVQVFALMASATLLIGLAVVLPGTLSSMWSS